LETEVYVTAKLMLDTSVENFDLFMLYADLAQAQTITLPAGYSYRYFDCSAEDIKSWVNIIVSSGGLANEKVGFEYFDNYYRAHIATLARRCFFILNSKDQPVGTATGFFIVDPQLQLPAEVTGHLSWVAIRKKYQGLGLSKPLISHAMKIMHEQGHQAAFLHTQTPSWLAAKVCLDLGWKAFRYTSSQENFTAAWQIVEGKIAFLSRSQNVEHASPMD